MAYGCELGMGQKVYLDNQGMQTIVIVASSSPGQQQQASSSFQTGSWIAPPELYRISGGVLLKITTAQGEQFIQIQGGSMTVMNNPPPYQHSQQLQIQTGVHMPPAPMPPMEPMQPMQPLEPMQPMTLGKMQMNLNPMEMRMGDMAMRMGSPASTTSQRRFCSQCGSPVEPSDRFCSNCGHRLN